tara:strand:- start:905 stop:1540 length:636 start_codon:yes stop_codon:yes gene_type:complete
MYFDKNSISNLEKIKRINLMNSITGIKPVLLVGTKSLDNINNLAIFSSIVHISSKPPLIGFFLRTNKKIRRDTFENIIEQNDFTLNHIPISKIKPSHCTSIKFDKNISEFDTCGFSDHYIDNFTAPFVKESYIKLGLVLKEVVIMNSTESKLIIGEVNHILFSDKYLNEDFSINLEKSQSASINGLNHYYKNKKVISLPYARKSNISEILK